ncbi:MAG: hypothetical protein LC130_10880 [Bryobacterales bacterium]|nr:hypothetical protein [Bryobacterales bacterium]
MSTKIRAMETPPTRMGNGEYRHTATSETQETWRSPTALCCQGAALGVAGSVEGTEAFATVILRLTTYR